VYKIYPVVCKAGARQPIAARGKIISYYIKIPYCSCGIMTLEGKIVPLCLESVQGMPEKPALEIPAPKNKAL
jgi:hypothetical protein